MQVTHKHANTQTHTGYTDTHTPTHTHTYIHTHNTPAGTVAEQGGGFSVVGPEGM